jgi:hypothetical protein
MAPRIELLKQAGFSDAEVADWATAERQRMHDAGFAEDEIDAEFGVTRPPREPPQAFIDRMREGNAAQRIGGAAGEYAQRYFGDAPLGFSPKNEEFLHRMGFFGDLLIPAAKPVDAALRAVPAGIGGLGAGIGQALEEAEDAVLGPGPQAKGKAARDFAELAQIAAILSGTGHGGPAPLRAPAASPVLQSSTLPRAVTASAESAAIALPRAEDFRKAAAAITGRPSSFRTEQTLLQLWKERGLTPAEIAQEAMRDPAIAAALAAEADKLPPAAAAAAREGVREAAKESAKATAEETAAAREQRAPAPPAMPEPVVPAPAASAEADRLAAQPPGPRALAEEAAAKAAGDRPSPGQSGHEPVMVADSKDIMLYAPPRIWQRPFSFDYRKALKTGDAGRLLVDIDGRPLVAQHVAGRRFAGRADQPLSPADIKDVLNQVDIRLIPTKKIPGQPDDVMGQYTGYQLGKRPVGEIHFKTALTPMDRDLVIGHEFGHGLDHFTRTVSNRLTPAEIAELRKIYPTLRAGGPRKTPKPQPEDFQYDPDQVNRELVAEGFRAYLTNPNYFKTYAPKTAAKFRSVVNRNQYLKRVIQLNSLGGAALLASGLGRAGQEEQ